MTQFVALLRGINVGGKNLIRMPELKACFEKQGLHDVVTYIQSGNVLFIASASGAQKLAGQLEEALANTFNCRTAVVLRNRRQMEDILGRAPAGFGEEPVRYRYDVIFLKEPLTAAAAIKTVPAKEGVDQAHAGPGVLYFSRLISKAAQSRLSRIVSLPIYQSMTIRNWNTTRTLMEMMRAADS
jgi:uncharacterized protein (DUF1697 family)